MEAGNIGKVILLLFIYLVSLPLIIYYTHRFYQHKSKNIVLFRQPLLIVCLNFMVIASFVLDRTPRYLSSIIGFKYPMWTVYLLSGSTSYGIINLLAIKSYLLFYMHRYHTAIQNKTWAKAINDNWSNWYIHNKNKFGDFHYILKCLFVPYIIEPFITAFGELIWGFGVNVSLQFVFTIIPISLIFICAIKLGQFYDNFGIRREILIQFLLLTVGIMIYFPIVTVSRAHLSEQTYDVLYDITQGLILIILYTILALSSVYYPLHLIKRNKIRHELTIPNSNCAITISNLLECFIDYQMFCKFMNHLVKEFSTESALFILEWCQIKNAYQLSQNRVIKISNKHKSYSDNSEFREPYIVIDLNECLDDILPSLPVAKTISISSSTSIVSIHDIDIIPDSILSAKTLSKSKSKILAGCISTYIVEDKNMIKIQISQQVPESGILQQYPDIKSQVKALYDKYIIDGCAHQINIPFSLKNPATKLILQLESQSETDHMLCEGDLWCSMDRICYNILGLLLNPYSRFKLGRQYMEYVNSAEYKSTMKELEMMGIHGNTSTPTVFEGSLYDQICEKYKVLNCT